MRKFSQYFVGLIIVGSLVFCTAGLAAETDSCVSCHSDLWDEMKSSVHSRNGISCHFCHGGDTTKADEVSAHSTEAGFIGVPDKAQIADKCGSCHADVEMMNFYGLRTDQLAQYKT